MDTSDDPVTLMIVAGSIQAVSTLQQGRAAREQGEMQAAIAERNAQLAERQAEAERLAAVEAAKVQEREGKELLARQKVLFAKGRVEVGRGAPLSVLVDTAEILERDRLTILREGAISAAQARGQADVMRFKGRAAKAKGRAAYRGSKLAATGTILSTVGMAGYMKYGPNTDVYLARKHGIK